MRPHRRLDLPPAQRPSLTMLKTSLTSTAITTNSSGVRQTELRYFAYGGTRYDAGAEPTCFHDPSAV
jgi:hypothetical protein